MNEQTPPEPKKYLRVNVRGKKPSAWKKMRKNLVKQVEGLMATTVDREAGTTVGSELRGLTSSAFDFVRSKLDRPGLENAELEAKVDYLHAQASTIRMQARETAARAEAQEIKNAFGKLRLILESAKVVARMCGEPDDELLCFVRDIEAFQSLLQVAADSIQIGEPPTPPKIGPA